MGQGVGDDVALERLAVEDLADGGGDLLCEGLGELQVALTEGLLAAEAIEVQHAQHLALIGDGDADVGAELRDFAYSLDDRAPFFVGDGAHGSLLDLAVPQDPGDPLPEGVLAPGVPLELLL